MPMTLPTRLYQARTVQVLNLNCVLVSLSLNFGISLQKNLVIEGIDGHSVPQHLRSDAKHCLVCIVGGRDLLVHTDASTLDGFLKARVFLEEAAEGMPDGTLAVPYDTDQPRLEVGLMWRWAESRRFDPREVQRYMRLVAKG